MSVWYHWASDHLILGGLETDYYILRIYGFAYIGEF